MRIVSSRLFQSSSFQSSSLLLVPFVSSLLLLLTPHAYDVMNDVMKSSDTDTLVAFFSDDAGGRPACFIFNIPYFILLLYYFLSRIERLWIVSDAREQERFDHGDPARAAAYPFLLFLSSFCLCRLPIII